MHATSTIAPTLIPPMASGLNFEELSLLPPAAGTAVVLLLPSVALAMRIDVGDKEAEVFVDCEVRDDKIVTENSDRLSGARAWNVSSVGSSQSGVPFAFVPQQCQREVVELYMMSGLLLSPTMGNLNKNL